VQELDDGRYMDMLVALIAAGPGSEYRHQRAQALATGADDIFADLADHRHIGVQAVSNELVDRGKFVGDDGVQIFEIHGGFRLGCGNANRGGGRVKVNSCCGSESRVLDSRLYVPERASGTLEDMDV